MTMLQPRCLRPLLIISVLAIATTAVAAATLTGKVVKIADGDTLTLLVDKTQIRVRLEGIDTPERGQPFGRKAGQALAKKVFGKVVQVDDLGRDRYGRRLGTVRLDKRNVNLDLVREGWAWRYRKYAPKNKELASAEAAARKAKRGLWADAKPIPPWDWRQSERDKRLKSRSDVDTGYWLNTSTGVRHNRSCRNYRNTKRGRPCGAEEGKACGMCGVCDVNTLSTQVVS
jgi:endonuclease YncB( thermonuclease family)